MQMYKRKMKKLENQGDIQARHIHYIVGSKNNRPPVSSTMLTHSYMLNNIDTLNIRIKLRILMCVEKVVVIVIKLRYFYFDNYSTWAVFQTGLQTHGNHNLLNHRQKDEIIHDVTII